MIPQIVIQALVTCAISAAGTFPPDKKDGAAVTSQPASARAKDIADQVGPMLGTHNVKVWENRWPSRYVELAERMSRAVAKRQEWWLEYVKNAEAGEDLPYHKNLGLSRSEYSELLRLAKLNEIKVVARTTLTAKRRDDGVVEFETHGDIEDLSDLRIDLVNQAVSTPIGRLVDPTWIERNPTRTIGRFGEWEGWQWKHTRFDEQKVEGATVDLTIGRLGHFTIVCSGIRNGGTNLGRRWA